MTILFLSNYFNHHQSTLADGLFTVAKGHFWFVSCGQMPTERMQLGCAADKRDYVVAYAGNEAMVEAWIRQADVVIAGSAPEKLVRQRVKTGKLLFRYRERPLRKGPELLKMLPRLLRWHWRDPAGKPIYLLCASAYTAGDYAKYGLFRDRAFRWGYFPECRAYDLTNLLSKKEINRILWCGRLVELKHPEAAIEAARTLKTWGYDFRLDILGDGPLREPLQKIANGLEEVRFWGLQSAAQVRSHMENAGIFLFTSDAREGWGAVVNEAMGSGCAVVASDAAGAVPYLIRDGENGLVYESGNGEALTANLRQLLDSPQMQAQLGAAAYRTIQNCWNGTEAARRLVRLAEELISGGDGQGLFSEGPCSPA